MAETCRWESGRWQRVVDDRVVDGKERYGRDGREMEEIIKLIVIE